MFNKKRCKKCKYHMTISGGAAKKGEDDIRTSIMCGYALITHNTCLKDIEGEIYDMRGDDPDCCLLFNSSGKRVNTWLAH